MTAAPTTPLLLARVLPRFRGCSTLAGVRRLVLARAAIAGLLAAVFLLGHGVASALGFGRLSVQSSQGQPLQAQIQVTSLSPAEQASLRLRVAPPQVHQTAGLVFDDVLASLKADLVRQADGGFVVQLTSDRPVSNVYVDLILEARWASGQRLMGYTLLVSPEGTPPPPVAQVSPLLGGGASAAPAEGLATSTGALPSQHAVKYGETLSELAQQYRPEGVSLDQMLVALYQANPQAFMGENMNRLKTGAVLKLPGAEAARVVPPVPARELIKAHSADFGAYRSRLAGQVREAASEPAASRQARGQVQARVQDRKEDAVATPDQLKLSQGGVRAASSPEAALSRDAAAREAAEREAELARNVQALKELQQQASASSVAAGGQTAAAPPAEGASVPAGAPTVAAAVPAAASTVAAASAAASAASAPPVMTLTEPGWLQRLLASPYTVPGAAGLVILMAVWGGYRLWRGRRRDEEAPAEEEERAELATEEPAMEAQALPVAEMSDIVEEVAMAGDLDAVAEADVHLAYGSDERAAAVLRSAMEAEPDRLDLRVKMLEVLALQRDSMSFEPLALEVQKMTEGKGSTWEHVKAMGQELDPYNPLYGGRQADLTGYEATPGQGQAAFDADGEPIERPELDLEGYGDGDAPGMPALDADSVASRAARPLDLEGTPAQTPQPDLDAYGTARKVEKSPELDYGKSVSIEAGPEPEYEAVEPEKYDIELGDPLADEKREMEQGEAGGFQRAPLDVPQVDLADEDSAVDDASQTAASPPPPPPPDMNHPLGRKLTLAKEFLEIGDMEGARDLLDEVYAQATGSLKDSASQLLDSME
ncbi:MAG: FimV/HubP family polar landmark protein [Betaproteobacteria bacterium]